MGFLRIIFKLLGFFFLDLTKILIFHMNPMHKAFNSIFHFILIRNKEESKFDILQYLIYY